MNSATTAASSVGGIIFTILVVLILWHWIESGAGVTTGIRMAWQDVKDSVSCRSIDTAARFVGRPYEDHLADRELFRLPRWRNYICPVYAEEIARTPEARGRIVQRAIENLSISELQALVDYADDRGVDRIVATNVQAIKFGLHLKKQAAGTR